MSETAYRYAAALRRTDCRADVFLTSARAIPAQSELWQVMIDPSIGLREKHAVLDRLPELKEQPMLRNFYKLLVDKHRFSMLPEIADAYHDILLHERGESVCTLRCVRVPDDQRLSVIARTLCRQHKKRGVEMHVVLDPDLIGGFVIEIDGVTYDKSVRGQIAGMAQRIQRGERN